MVSLGLRTAPIGGVVLKGPIADQIPENLPQQLAMNLAKSGQGARVIMENLMDAPRLAANYGAGEWVKMQSVLRGSQGNITVHWFRNGTTLDNLEYKFAHIASPYR